MRFVTQSRQHGIFLLSSRLAALCVVWRGAAVCGPLPPRRCLRHHGDDSCPAMFVRRFDSSAVCRPSTRKRPASIVVWRSRYRYVSRVNRRRRHSWRGWRLYRDAQTASIEVIGVNRAYGKFGPKPGIPIGRDISYSTTAGLFGYGSVLPVLANPNRS